MSTFRGLVQAISGNLSSATTLVEHFSYQWYESAEDKTTLLNIYVNYLSELKAFLLANKQKHFIVVPIFCSSCERDIKARRIRIFTGTEREKIDKLIKLSGISKKRGMFFSEHTKSSRSPMFFKYPLMIIPLFSHTDSVRLRSVDLSKIYFYIIRLFWMAETKTTVRKDIGRFELRYLEGTSDQENTHLAIWTKRYANFSHSPLWYNISLKTDLSFIEKRINVVDKMISSIVLENDKSVLNRKFFNAIIMLNKGIDLEIRGEESLALLVYLSTIESLVCENRNEKGLRLASILPKLSKIKDKKIQKSSKILQELYLLRNDFVHAAIDRKISSIDLKVDVNPLILLTSLLSNLIINNFDSTNKMDLSDWNKKCDELFEKKVFG